MIHTLYLAGCNGGFGLRMGGFLYRWRPAGSLGARESFGAAIVDLARALKTALARLRGSSRFAALAEYWGRKSRRDASCTWGGRYFSMSRATRKP
jgi:hypothetical protein